MAFCIIVFYVCLIILVLESPQSCVALMVRKAIVLNQLISSKEWIRPTYYKKVSKLFVFLIIGFQIVLEVDHNIYTGFLITMVNKIEMNAETCSVFDNLALMEINSKNISFGCSHYLVHYANSPLIIRLAICLWNLAKANSWFLLGIYSLFERMQRFFKSLALKL